MRGAPSGRPSFLPQVSVRRLASEPLRELGRLGEAGSLAVGFLGRQRLIYVSEPALVDAVFRGSDRFLGRARPIRRWWLVAPAVRLEGPELSTHDRSVYLRTRRTLMPFYGRDAARALLPVLAEVAEAFLDDTNGREVRLVELLDDLLAASAVCMLIGAGAPLDELRAVAALYKETGDTGVASFTSPVRSRVAAIRYRRRRERAAAAREEIGRRLVGLRRSGVATAASVAGLLERGEISVDLASGLMETVPEPTASPLVFLVSAIARRDVAGRLGPEADAVLSGGDLREAPATDAAVHEALRLGAPWRTNRIVLTPFTVAGLEAKVGDIFVASPALLHRDARFWDRPLAFSLDHWTAARRPRRAFFPFGFASRACLGKRMATAHLAGLAALLVRDWHVECEDVTAIDWRAAPDGLVKPAREVRCRFVRRAESTRTGVADDRRVGDAVR